MAKILILEPYAGGSHAAWLRGYQAHSRHDVSALTLSGEYWQWRMLGGAISLAETFDYYLTIQRLPDVILATDMLDLARFLGLTRHITANIPTAVYFHENQISYPYAARIKPKRELMFNNYSSALVADRVFFNSAFHQNSFVNALPRFLNHYPEPKLLHTIDAISQKSSVLPVGVDLARLDAHRQAKKTDPAPLIIWNHRWDADKNPQGFVEALRTVHEMGLDFRLALLGESNQHQRGEFEAARAWLGAKLIHMGYADLATYARLLWEGDVIVSTAIQEFFGVSIVEGVYCGAWPILPKRLNYPHLIPAAYHANMLYEDAAGLVDLLKWAIETRPRPPSELVALMAGYDWRRMALVYDAVLGEMG